MGQAEQLPEGGRPHGGTLSGDIRSHTVSSTILGEKRKIWIYLPPCYEQEPDKHFPVLYTCDGGSDFDARTAAHHVELGLDEAAEQLIASGQMGELIIVAVNHGAGPDSRRDDYTPDADPRYGGGHADRYLAFLKNELKPMVDNTYRTRPEAEETGIFGSSLGGLFALYAGFTEPHTFGVVSAVSPSLWYGGKEILHRLQSAPEGPNRVYLDVGTAEANPDWSLTPVEDLEEAAHLLEMRGYHPGENLFYHVYQGAEHTNAAWHDRAPEFMASLYPAARYHH